MERTSSRFSSLSASSHNLCSSPATVEKSVIVSVAVVVKVGAVFKFKISIQLKFTGCACLFIIVCSC